MAVATRYRFWEFSGEEKNISTKILHHIYWLTIRYLRTKYEDRHFFPSRATFHSVTAESRSWTSMKLTFLFLCRKRIVFCFAFPANWSLINLSPYQVWMKCFKKTLEHDMYDHIYVYIIWYLYRQHWRFFFWFPMHCTAKSHLYLPTQVLKQLVCLKFNWERWKIL